MNIIVNYDLILNKINKKLEKIYYINYRICQNFKDLIDKIKKL